MKQKLLLLSGLLLLSLTSNAQIEVTKSTIDASTPAKPYAVATADLTNDGNIDLAIGTYDSSVVTWYKNNGDDTFETGITLEATGTAALSYIESITIADLNTDGHNDILATGSYNDNLVWFENNGDETFQPAVLIATGIAGAGAVKVANIDNDVNDNLDIIVTAYTSNSVVYFLGNGDGTFGTMRTLALEGTGAGPASFDIGDYDDDGDLDVVVGYTGNGDVKLYDNTVAQDGLDIDGNVIFVPYTNTVDADNGWLWSVIFADVNNDGNLNIVKSDSEPTSGNPTLAWFTNASSGIDTTFTEAIVSTSFSHGGAVSVADLNNNGSNDLILGNSYVSGVDLICFEGHASGTLSDEIVLDDTTGSIFSMALADFNNDNKLDIAAISYLANDVTVFYNNTTLSTTQFKLTDVVLYPNPTKDFLMFEGLDNNITVSVYDLLGKQVISQPLAIGETLDVSELALGIYTLKINNEVTSKFIKE
ncbi:T9SS type A sorting domain-containing protein [Winogradskyella thalassocola]|uniref:Por secretion system C-terminal sorting domain-containing protein n=1 Tax=Winogradskyella thalassocola TaxID=262004 RepID=A0A1G8DBD5_9FLAO|nr:T9SS type A sorting domain-containing protein [Winogradskyella thalassocola]SDH55016.1 Por secretion system C-terminal sorting domain-containing protein [Winogradskyella thalassocola]